MAHIHSTVLYEGSTQASTVRRLVWRSVMDEIYHQNGLKWSEIPQRARSAALYKIMTVKRTANVATWVCIRLKRSQLPSLCSWKYRRLWRKLSMPNQEEDLNEKVPAQNVLCSAALYQIADQALGSADTRSSTLQHQEDARKISAGAIWKGRGSTRQSYKQQQTTASWGCKKWSEDQYSACQPKDGCLESVA